MRYAQSLVQNEGKTPRDTNQLVTYKGEMEDAILGRLKVLHQLPSGRLFLVIMNC